MVPRDAHAEKPVLLRSADGAQIIIHAFPFEQSFVRDVRRAALAANPTGLADDDVIRERLKIALRTWYPMVDVRGRDELADVSRADRVWYVLRDGHVGRPRERIDRLHAALSQARDLTASAHEAVAHARSAIELAARPRPGGQREDAFPAGFFDDRRSGRRRR